MSFRRLFWSACSALSPDLHLTLKSTLGARRSRAVERKMGQSAYTAAFLRRHGPAVLAGPFKGLKFPAAAFGHNLVPKLMGVYEYHLQPAVEAAIARHPARVANIGAAEGYYTVGFGLRLPEARIYSFDAAPVERGIAEKVAAENGVASRVEVRGICRIEWLRDHLQPGDFVFSDCEGGEDSLCDPTKAPVLRNCDLLVECHEEAVPGVTERIVARFQATHEIERVRWAAAARQSLPPMDGWTEDDYARAMSDGRTSDQQWLVMVARERR